ncbi:MAG: hypothetical protein ACOCPZ_02595 [Natrialbaceae archaeon]
METLKDLVAACRDAAGPVVETAGRTAPYTYEEFVPNVWKAGNLLGHYGVHPGAEVTVVVGPKTATPEDESRRIDAADPLFAILGATLVGAAVRLEPVEPVDSRALVLPAGWADRYETTARCSRLAYGGPPTEADVAHFEEELWSENPIEPPERVDASDAALVDGEGEYSHGDLLAVADEVVGEYDLATGDRVAFDAPVTEVGAVVALPAVARAGATLSVGEAGGDLTVTDAENGGGEGELTVAALTASLRDTRRA